MQVEDTLNNSNDLFLTFRKEMEEMSKKTKRLEKENDNMKRKHDAMNQNILKMADERTQNLKDIDDAKKREEKLRNIITQMQQQGRGIGQGGARTVDNYEVDGEESDYEYEDEEDLSDVGAEYGEDDADLTEEEQEPARGAAAAATSAQQPFGPVPPPVTANGH